MRHDAGEGDGEFWRRYAVEHRDIEHPPTKCGKCGGEWTRSSAVKGKPLPKPGTFCICSYCGTICRYDEKMQGQPVSAKELRQQPRAFRAQLEKLSEALLRARREVH